MSRRLLIVASVAYVLVAAVTLARIVDGLDTPPADTFAGDWRDATYYPVRAVLDGANPYDVADYLATYPAEEVFPPYGPHHLVLHSPFAVGDFVAGTTIWTVVNLLLLPVLGAVSLRRFVSHSWRPPAALATATVALAFDIGQTNSFGGQSTIEVTIGVVLAIDDDLPWWLRAGGVVLACQKPPHGIALLAMLIGVRAWPTLVRGLGLTVALALVALVPIVAAAGGVGELLDTIGDSTDASAAVDDNDLSSPPFGRIDLAAAFARSTGVDPRPAGEVLVAVGVLAAGALAVSRTTRFADTLALTALVTTLALPHHLYDGLLVVPLAWGLWYSSLGRRARLAAMGVLAAMTVATTTTHYLHVVLEWIDYDHRARAALVSYSLVAVVVVAAVDQLASKAPRRSASTSG